MTGSILYASDMPSVFTLEGHPPQAASSLGDRDDNALVQWLHTQNPVVAVGVGLGLSLAIGFVLAQTASWILEKKGAL